MEFNFFSNGRSVLSDRLGNRCFGRTIGDAGKDDAPLLKR